MNSRVTYSACAALLVLVACRISDSTLDGLPCPCASTRWQCDEATNTCVPADPGPFSLAITRPWNVLPQTQSGILTVELTTETQQSIIVQFNNLPAGITAAPGRLTLSPSSPIAELTVTASTAAAIGPVMLELEGTGPAGDRQLEQISVEIGGRPGTLDPTFGNSGISAIVAGGLTFPVMTLLTDDRIVVAGAIGRDCVVAQYTADGQIDTGFGSSGVTHTSTGDNQIACLAYGITHQPDGNIVVVGQWGIPGIPVMLRYLANGVADPSFGTAGVSLVPGTTTTLQAVAVRGDGLLVAVGSNYDGAGGGHIVLFRFLADGTPDPAFGAGGYIVTALGTGDSAYSMRLLPDGRFVVAGARLTSPPTGLLARFLADGSLDPSFGSGGLIVGEPRNVFTTLLLRSDGNLVVGGMYSDGGIGDIADGSFIRRYDTAGQLDPSFGDGGVTVFDSTQPPNQMVVGIVETPLVPVVVADRGLLMALDADGRLDSEFGYVGTPSVVTGLEIQTSGKLIAIEMNGSLMRLWP